jgi:hypothetical protein
MVFWHTMMPRLSYSTVRHTKRQPIYVLRIHDEILEFAEIDQLAARMGQWLAHRGEATADIVIVQGDSKETLRLFGDSFSTGRVREAMFNAALGWRPISLDQ